MSRPSSISTLKLTYLLFLPVFFASGFAALLYQMVWQRLLTFWSGADLYAVTLIVGVYMAGLGFGSLAGGHLADRLRTGQRYLAFALAEAAVAAFALLSRTLIYDTLFLRLGEQPLPPAAVAAVLFLCLLWPTFFMGLSLPLLARIVTDRPEISAERIGGLYGWNTLGAATGALASMWIVVRLLGFDKAIQVGAAINGACALGALAVAVLGRRHAVGRQQARAAGKPAARAFAPAVPVLERRLPFRAWLALYALSGFVALSLELLWFRVLGIILKSSSFTFATLLAIYLLGLGAGALLGARLARRSPRPAAAFFGLQAAIGLYAGLSLALVAFLLSRAGGFELLRSYLSQLVALDLGSAVNATLRYLRNLGQVAPYARHLAQLFLLLYCALPLLLFGPPTTMMGMSFPFLQKAVQTDVESLGRRVGWLQAANIVGSTIGVVLTGVGLLHWLGSSGTLRLLVGLSGVFLVLRAGALVGGGRRRALATAAALAVVALAVALSPGPGRLWAALHGTSEDRILFVEDGSGLSLIKDGIDAESGAPMSVFYVNGLSHSHLPYGSYHTVLGALPALLHPRPVDVAVVGLGSGDTVFGIAGRPETERIDCIEIVASELPALTRRAARGDYPGLGLLLRDGRVRYHFTDGRTFLMRTERRYDVIEADALWPDSAYAGNLYSREYFQLLQRRLKPGGYAVTWSPTPRVRDTFVSVFPHVLQVGDTLVGSDARIEVDRAVLRERMNEWFAAQHYARGRVQIEALIEDAFKREVRVVGPAEDRSRLTDLNTDLFPKDELLASRRLWRR